MTGSNTIWRNSMSITDFDPKRFDASDSHTWPRTIDQAVAVLLITMSEKDKQALRDTPSDKLMAEYHFSLGLWIRNAFGLWKDNEELLEDADEDDMGVFDPDDASMMIIWALWKALQTEKR
jgi:hypothetical protein